MQAPINVPAVYKYDPITAAPDGTMYLLGGFQANDYVADYSAQLAAAAIDGCNAQPMDAYAYDTYATTGGSTYACGTYPAAGCDAYARDTYGATGCNNYVDCSSLPVNGCALYNTLPISDGLDNLGQPATSAGPNMLLTTPAPDTAATWRGLPPSPSRSISRSPSPAPAHAPSPAGRRRPGTPFPYHALKKLRTTPCRLQAVIKQEPEYDL